MLNKELIMNKTSFVKSADGTALFVREHVVDQNKPCVLLVHGFSEHSGRYKHVIEDLNKAGFNVLAFDFRGHGQSAGMRGYIDDFSQYIADIHAIVKFAQTKFATKKVFIVAHSMGGLAATHYAHEFGDTLNGLVLSSPLFAVKVKVPKWKEFISVLTSKYVPTFSMPNDMGSDNLTHDKKYLADYDKDELVLHLVRARWFTEIKKACLAAQKLVSEVKVPLLMQLSNDDKIVDYEESLQCFEKNSSTNKSLIIYDGFYHEIYNETDRQRPINDALEWLNKRANV